MIMASRRTTRATRTPSKSMVVDEVRTSVTTAAAGKGDDGTDSDGQLDEGLELAERLAEVNIGDEDGDGMEDKTIVMEQKTTERTRTTTRMRTQLSTATKTSGANRRIATRTDSGGSASKSGSVSAIPTMSTTSSNRKTSSRMTKMTSTAATSNATTTTNTSANATPPQLVASGSNSGSGRGGLVVDDLAEQLASGLTLTQRKPTKTMTMAGKTTVHRSGAPMTNSKGKGRDLTDTTITGTTPTMTTTATATATATLKSKGKLRAPKDTAMVEDPRITSMRSVNAASQALSNAIKSGWKKPKDTANTPSLSSGSLTSVAGAAAAAAKHLRALRGEADVELDVERAAMSVLGKLVALELYDIALDVLKDVHPRLCGLLRVPVPASGRGLSLLRFLSIPLPESTAEDPLLLSMASTYLLCALTTLTHTQLATLLPSPTTTSKAGTPSSPTNPTNLSSFSTALRTTPTLLAWTALFAQSLSQPALDSTLTKAYTVLTKTLSTYKGSEFEAAFLTRMYGLECLACTSSGTVESDTFWEQATKFGAAFVQARSRAISAAEEGKENGVTSEEQVARVIVGGYEELTVRARMRADAKDFLSGKGFVGFCEYWMAFAKRVGDICALDRIAALLHGTHGGTSSLPPPQQAQEKATSAVAGPSSNKDGERKGRRVIEERTVEGAKFCALMAQMTALLEQDPPADDLHPRTFEFLKTLDDDRSTTILSLVEDAGQEDRRVVARADRAFERLRRAALKVLETSPSVAGLANPRREAAQSVVSSSVAVLEKLLKAVQSTDLFTRTLDSLFCLSRTGLDVHDSRTYVPSHEHLRRATAILNIPPPANTPPEISRHVDKANYTRCVSGAFHNLAGTLYQADRLGSAIAFLKDGCELGALALEMRNTEKTGKPEIDGEDSKTKEGWNQLEEQLYRRWELLGVCYSKTGDNRNAVEAFRQAIKAFPFVQSGLESLVDSSTVGTIFEHSAATKQLGALIDRVTYITTSELLLEVSSISLGSLDIDQDKALTGVFIERQVESLEQSRWKPIVQKVIAGLLRETLEVYGSEEMPLRRARVIVKCLELMYHCGSEVEAVIGSTPEQLGMEVERMLSEPGRWYQDEGLSSYSAQYRASASLWLALHAHRRADPQQIALIIARTEEARGVLRTLMANMASLRSTPRTSAVHKGSSPKQVAAAPKSVLGRGAYASRMKSVKRAAAKTSGDPPVTPKPRNKAFQRVSLSATSPRSIKPSLVFDDFEKFISLLRLTTRILGILALTIPQIHILDLTRKLCDLHSGTSSDGCVLASVELAHEYVKLGRTRRAGSIFMQTMDVIKAGGVSSEVCVSFFLRFAEALASAEDVDRSSAMYLEAIPFSERLETEDKPGSTLQRIHTRVKRLEGAAVAAYVFALIQNTRGEPSVCLQAMLQSLRLWNRAFDTLARLTTPTRTGQASNLDPFEAVVDRNAPSTLHREQPPPKKVYAHKPSMDGLEWRVSDGLLGTLFALCQLYFARGSAREAEYFAVQAQELAESLNSPAMVGRALTKRGEIQIHQGLLREGLDSLMQANDLLSNLGGIDTAELQRLRGVHNRRSMQHQNAEELFEATRSMLEMLDATLKQFDGVAFGPRKSTGNTPDSIVPELIAAILGQQITVISDNGGDYKSLLEKLLSLPQSSRIKAESSALMARLCLQEVHARFRSDMFLSSLTESTIALPIGMTTSKQIPLSPSTQQIVSALDDAERLYWEDLALAFQRGLVSHVRHAVLSLAQIRAFQTSLGNSEQTGPAIAADLLDLSAAITLRREMLEAIQHKLSTFPSVDDLQWPLLSLTGAPQPQPRTSRGLRFDDNLDPFDEEPGVSDPNYLKRYWESRRVKYQSQISDPASLLSKKSIDLPSNWAVVHISITEDRSALFVSRQQGGAGAGTGSRSPLVFCAPLKGRRDNGTGEEEEEHLTFEDALNEFNDIVKSSDEGTKAAIHVKNDDQHARAAWWKTRSELDTRLRELLENIEFCWFGAFKTVLNQQPRLTTGVLDDLRTQFEKVFHSGLHLQDIKTKDKTARHKKSASSVLSPNQVKFDDALIECFSTLSPKCRDEELEDLIYFMLDLYQFHGVPVAIAEVDITQMVVDVRAILEDHSLKMRATEQQPSSDSKLHTFLILDRSIQGLPWESLPILRGRSVSRIPSLDFLEDRVELSRLCHAECSASEGVPVNPRKGFFVLNPSGDLGRTEERFKDWTSKLKAIGWNGVVGHAPSEQQLLEAMRTQDIVVYFGHGGGEQYARSHKIRHLSKCAVTMLWGCSSGALREMGDFDRIGTPHNYMLAGCPTLVANLWDVTDRDIDKFSQSVFDKMGLSAEAITSNATHMTNPPRLSAVAAVGLSRDACKLTYLTGAAPVVYGIPFYLSDI